MGPSVKDNAWQRASFPRVIWKEPGVERRVEKKFKDSVTQAYVE